MASSLQSEGLLHDEKAPPILRNAFCSSAMQHLTLPADLYAETCSGSRLLLENQALNLLDHGGSGCLVRLSALIGWKAVHKREAFFQVPDPAHGLGFGASCLS